MSWLPPAPEFLPNWLLDFDLVHGFLWYISIMFVVSMALRLRFYRGVYNVARHVADSCPSVYGLLREHWFLCLSNGIFLRSAIYLALMTGYMVFNRLVWPLSHSSLRTIAKLGPEWLVLELALIGVMMAIDLVLLFQVSVIDEARIRRELTEADGWLGGRINQFLQFLGKWNPIKKYADYTARETLRWFNEVTCTSIMSLSLQLVVRICAVGSLFACYVVQP